MPNYKFNIGNSGTGGIGLVGRVSGSTPELALATLQEVLKDALNSDGAVRVRTNDPAVEYIDIYISPENITVENIDEVDDPVDRETEGTHRFSEGETRPTSPQYQGPRGNTRVFYQYRDGNNFKNLGYFVVAGSWDETLHHRLFVTLSDNDTFIAHQVRFPEVFIWDPNVQYDPEDPPIVGPSVANQIGPYMIREEDHSWHQFVKLEHTADEPNDPHGRTITQLVEEFERVVAPDGPKWEEFEPISRRTPQLGVTVICPPPQPKTIESFQEERRFEEPETPAP